MASESYALRSIRPVTVQVATLLACFGSGLLLDHVEQLGPSIVVLTVVLGMTLGRTQRTGDTRHRLLTLAVLPVLSVACTEVGRLFVEHPNVADALFVAALATGVWLRRFGPRGTRLGTLIALPFLALLVTPLPQIPGAMPPVGRSMLWAAVASVVAYGWVWLVQTSAERIGLVPPLPRGTRAAPEQRSSARIPASTRMAVQLGLSLALAFVIGRSLFAPHWSWIVITAFVVNSGNRGRGDVVYKSLQRIAGAAIGTVVATLLAGLFPPRDNVAVAVILAALALGSWLRTLNYAYWAGCVTSVLSLLQGYFGETHIGLLGERLAQILIGGALAVLVAWFVLPVKSADVLRKRLAGCLAALQEVLAAAARHEPEALQRHAREFEASLAQLELVAPPTRAHRRLQLLRHSIRGTADGAVPAHQADAVEALRACGPAVEALATGAENPDSPALAAPARLLRGVSGNVAGARRHLGRREGAVHRPLDWAAAGDGRAAQALREIDTATRVIGRVYGSTQHQVERPPGQPVEA